MTQITTASHLTELRIRLKKLREGKRLSQDALAQKSKVNKQTIWRIETGRQTAVRKTTVDMLAAALGVSAEVLIGQAPLPESEQTRAGRPVDADYSINVPVDGAIRNAYTLTAMRYRVPITQIVKLAPFLFVLAAEGSLERRRSKLKEVKYIFDSAQDLAAQFLHLPSSFLTSGSHVPEISDEAESISSRDILGAMLPDYESIGSVINDGCDMSEYNPFVVFLKEAAGTDETVASIRSFDRDSGDFDVCYEDALKLVDSDEKLARSIIAGEVMLHKMLRELPNDATTAERIAWLHERREEHRTAVADLLSEL